MPRAIHLQPLSSERWPSGQFAMRTQFRSECLRHHDLEELQKLLQTDLFESPMASLSFRRTIRKFRHNKQETSSSSSSQSRGTWASMLHTQMKNVFRHRSYILYTYHCSKYVVVPFLSSDFLFASKLGSTNIIASIYFWLSGHNMFYYWNNNSNEYVKIFYVIPIHIYYHIGLAMVC